MNSGLSVRLLLLDLFFILHQHDLRVAVHIIGTRLA